MIMRLFGDRKIEIGVFFVSRSISNRSSARAHCLEGNNSNGGQGRDVTLINRRPAISQTSEEGKRQSSKQPAPSVAFIFYIMSPARVKTPAPLTQMHQRTQRNHPQSVVPRDLLSTLLTVHTVHRPASRAASLEREHCVSPHIHILARTNQLILILWMQFDNAGRLAEASIYHLLLCYYIDDYLSFRLYILLFIYSPFYSVGSFWSVFARYDIVLF